MPQVHSSQEPPHGPGTGESARSAALVEAVAQRVYELLRGELRTDRERGGLPAPWSPDR
jgi:hypothetical protein